MDPVYESVLLVKTDVLVFKIPPRTSNRGYRAADWNLQEPCWQGRMKLVAQGTVCCIKLEDKISGSLYAQCPIEQYPSVAIEAVTDSSRYFVLRIVGEGGRQAYIGVGFQDRSDSFDLNVALQDHFKWVKNQEQIEKEKEVPHQELDLKFKEGETIKINMKITKKDGGEGTSKIKPRTSTGPLLPPPGNVKIAPPPTKTPTLSPAHKPSRPGEWGDYSSAAQQPNQTSAGTTSTPTATNADWVQF